MRCLIFALAVLTVSRSISAQTPMLDAVRYEDLKAVQQLLNDGADPSAYDKLSGQTPLHMAASIGNVKLVRLLLDAGAKLDGPDLTRRTPLHAAAMMGKSETVKLLLERGAEVDSRGSSDETPLQAAARAGDIQSVELLLAKGADLSHRDDHEKSALDHAAASGQLAMVKRLIAAGADPKMPHPQYNLLAYATMGHNRSELVRYLIDQRAPFQFDADPLAAIASAVNHADLRTLEILLKYDVDANELVAGSGKRNLLHLAVLSTAVRDEKARTATIRLLLERGVSPTARDYRGSTPADYARELKRDAWLTSLLDVKGPSTATTSSTAPSASE